MDEIFETATLIQTGKIERFPLILMGTDYWEPLLRFLRERMVAEKTIRPEDVERIVATDSPDEAMERILDAATGQFGLRWEPAPRPSRVLGEKSLPDQVRGAAR